MKSSYKLVLLIVGLALFGLACGLGSTATEKLDEVKNTAEAAATQVEEIAETAAPLATAVAADVEKLATEVPQAGNGDTAADSGSGETEVAPLDISNSQSALDQLSSYRSETTIMVDGVDNDGKPVKGSMTTLQEATKDPEVIHAQMSGTGDVAKQSGGTEGVMLEWYVADGTMYLLDPTSGEWSTLPGDSTGFGDMLMSAEDIVDIPPSAKRDILPVTVNGVSTWHYTFDASDMPKDDTMNIESGSGEVWIARDGGYPVKMVIEVVGASTDSQDSGGGFFANGTMKIVYELKDINKNFKIEIPEAALNAPSMFGDSGTGSGDSGDSGSGAANIDLPMMDDANVEFSMAGMTSYTTSATVDEVIDFYRTELAKMGWENDPAQDLLSESGGFLEFTKDGSSISLIVDNSAGDGTTSVTLLTE